MNKINSPDTLAALALVPEQLVHYVRGVAGSELRFANGYAVYLGGGEAVLVAAPTADAPDLDKYAGEEPEIAPEPELERAIAEVSAWAGLTRLNVLGVTRPESAPVGAEGYAETHDSYLVIDLPFGKAGDNFSGVTGQKLRNMLRRASREVVIAIEPWSAEFQALAKSYTGSRVLEAGTRYIFEHLEAYAAAPGVKIFAARGQDDGKLHGFCIGDFTPFDTAFYMFAFRRPDAAPGTADLLLHAMVDDAQRQGHQRVNLGLAINGGIGFFKEKWGARRFMPLVECSWNLEARQPEKKGFFKSLFG